MTPGSTVNLMREPGHAGHAPVAIPVLGRPPVLRITPPSRWFALRFGELWAYRELLYFFVWRDIKIRYKQTAIGAAWAVLQPFLTMVVFSLFFGRLAHIPSGGLPYPIFYYSALLPWMYFATALQNTTNTIVENQRLITKVYFPRLIVPVATVTVALVDFLVSFCILLLLMLWYHFLPDWRILLLPVFVILAFFASIGPSLWITSLNVKYRDFRYVIPFLVQVGLYISPVGFSSNVVPHKWRLLYSLNPVVGVIDGFRWCILRGQSELYLPGLGMSIAIIAFFLWFGVRQFRQMEKSFADLI